MPLNPPPSWPYALGAFPRSTIRHYLSNPYLSTKTFVPRGMSITIFSGVCNRQAEPVATKIRKTCWRVNRRFCAPSTARTTAVTKAPVFLILVDWWRARGRFVLTLSEANKTKKRSVQKQAKRRTVPRKTTMARNRSISAPDEL